MSVVQLTESFFANIAGWEAMNRAVLPFLAAIAVAVFWLALRRRARPARAA